MTERKWTTESRLQAIHVSVWLFGMGQLIVDVLILLAVLR